MEKAESIIFLEALKNAVNFKGKANPKAVMGKLMKELPEYRKNAKEIKPLIDEIVNKINSWDINKQTEELLKLDPTALEAKEKVKEEKVLPELKPVYDKDGKVKPVVMRLAPYPSGALHIGNARMIVLNDEYVKRYKGKLILCFDDTIGTTLEAYERDRDKCKFVIPEAYDLIIDGLDWLGVNYDKKNIIYKSDRVEIYKQYAEEFISKDFAYVCDCDSNEFRIKYKKTGKECPCRSKSVEEHLERWKKMNDGTYKEGEAVVRLKTGMDQKDPAKRDHIIMRISDATHPRIGNKTRVWPLLDFSWGIDDYLLGVTHIIRGADLKKEGFIENFIWDLMGWDKAEIMLYGRLKFNKDFKLSKTEARVKIANGEYDGWDDPRTWSLQSLRARGIQADALRSALIDLGMSMSGINFSEDWIYSKNVKLIDELANRYWFVEKPRLMEINKLEKPFYIAEPYLHPNFPERGKRTVKITSKDNKAYVYISDLDTQKQMNFKGNKVRYPEMKIGDTFRLKDLFTVKIIDMTPEKISVEYVTEEMDRNIRKIQWVPQENHVESKVLSPNGKVLNGYAEGNVINLKPDSIIQFERYGYAKIRSIKKTNEDSPPMIYCYYTHS